MNKKFAFFSWALIVMQLLTAVFHSLSFFVKTPPRNDTERQLQDLLNGYHLDAGQGFHPTFANIMLSFSICFTLLCVLGGCINWYFKKQQLSPRLWKGLLLVETVVFGTLFVTMALLTFLPPIVCTGLILVFCAGAWYTADGQSQQG